MTGAEYIAEFLVRAGCRHVFAMTGGACAFMLDAVARHPELNLVCFQHEQAAAMAADAVWRVSRRPGVTMATSGPGATNLITGIACSYFDSIPTIHITGQVNQRESSAVHGANVRQSGFQETKIVEMVRPIVKHAVLVRTVDELRSELANCFDIATSGRMGPVLIDVPMDIQQAQMPDSSITALRQPRSPRYDVQAAAAELRKTLASASRPVVIWGGGVGRADADRALARWLSDAGLPFVSSWAGIDGFDHSMPNFLGQIGVYGNRGANFVVQNADTVIVFGSRLDNRQRSGNPANFASGAIVHVFDIDPAELQKYGGAYRTTNIDLADLHDVLDGLEISPLEASWRDYVGKMKARYFGKEMSSSAKRLYSLCPYEAVRRIQAAIASDAVVVADTGAALCWLFQAFQVKAHRLFTAGGNSPMGYALCAAIGAKLEAPNRQVISYNGDGGMQVNLQELETVRRLDLDIAIVVMNNGSYGIIKQFQDSYLGGRHIGSQVGYSAPDFGLIATAYEIDYARVDRPDDITPELFRRGPILIDVILSDQTLIEPKLELGRPINDQYPYLPDAEYADGNRFVAYPRPAGFGKGHDS